MVKTLIQQHKLNFVKKKSQTNFSFINLFLMSHMVRFAKKSLPLNKKNKDVGNLHDGRTHKVQVRKLLDQTVFMVENFIQSSIYWRPPTLFKRPIS